MPRPTSALAATEDRRRCTGESHQALHPLLNGRTEPLSIPSARHPAQAQLEAAVFLGVCRLGGRAAHPLGIVRLRPEPDRLTVRLLGEPYVIWHWAEFLLPRTSGEAPSDPRDAITGVPGLRWRREGSTICLYYPRLPARIVLTRFNPRWWERVTTRMQRDYQLLQGEPDWTPDEHAAHTATSASALEPAGLLSPLLRRIRATAGPGPVNSTDAWHCVGNDFRLETADGPPCPDLIHLLGTGPTGLGWRVTAKACTCLCDHRHGTCRVDFHDPASDRSVYYSNGKWGRTVDDEYHRALDAKNRWAFT
ncbi:hypothetical protein I5Q34_09575 [Streptomyces sp. AV19]|uniref:hypothetical protein n=1 Tax=Streptomyces sp. AV19 TaxID=2793068 RepID=UPI0018FE8055|nr:hypothetical protein [Streptomyces sp. AV19]MBH1934534.1 hypothetical protein [Streptomyces sp. AV19]MDG4536942.1 hypothetical protein [Streptomyces sp. AV19]